MSQHSTSLGGDILCAKASMLNQNVPPALVVQFLREHRSMWADSGVDAYSGILIGHLGDRSSCRATQGENGVCTLFLAFMEVKSKQASALLTFTNQAVVDLLETTLVALQDISLEKILNNSRKVLCAEFPKIMEQGFAYIPVVICMWSMGQLMSYEQAIAWKVIKISF